MYSPYFRCICISYVDLNNQIIAIHRRDMDLHPTTRMFIFCPFNFFKRKTLAVVKFKNVNWHKNTYMFMSLMQHNIPEACIFLFQVNLVEPASPPLPLPHYFLQPYSMLAQCACAQVKFPIWHWNCNLCYLRFSAQLCTTNRRLLKWASRSNCLHWELKHTVCVYGWHGGDIFLCTTALPYQGCTNVAVWGSRLVKWMETTYHKKWLKELSMLSLEKKRLKKDMITVFR